MDHPDSAGKIRRLQLAEQCKRRVEDMPLGQISDDVLVGSWRWTTTVF